LPDMGNRAILCADKLEIAKWSKVVLCFWFFFNWETKKKNKVRNEGKLSRVDAMTKGGWVSEQEGLGVGVEAQG
jgi:hypothetical protein